MRLLIIFSILFMGSNLFAEKMIRLGEDSYYMVNEETDDRRGTAREFVRSSETRDEWTTLIRVQELYRENSTKKYVDEVIGKFKSEHSDHPTIQLEMFNEVGTDAWGVDYSFIYVPPKKQKPVAEWTYFQARRNPENKGIIVNQFTYRQLMHDFRTAKEFSETLKTYRQEMVFALRTNDFVIEEGTPSEKNGAE